MNEWDILQIEETDDIAIIRKAYASLIKKYKPHEHPEKFKKIREAYDQIIKSIEYGIPLDNGNSENSIFQTAEEDNWALVNIDPTSLLDSHENNQKHEIEKFYIEYILELYKNLETRNNVEAWQVAIQRNSVELLMDDCSFDLILEYIIKSEYLYYSDFSLKPEIYILLFNFFNVDEGFYVSNKYSTYVSRPLLGILSEHRYDLRLASIQESGFNAQSPEVQIEVEDYYANVILNSPDLIAGHVKNLSEYFRTSNPIYVKVLGNVVFKDILDKYISATKQNDSRLVGNCYNLFRFKYSGKVFCKIFVQMGYSKKDIKNCLGFCKEMYVRYVQPPLWYRILACIPPLEIVFGLLFGIYKFIRKYYFMFFPKGSQWR